MVKKKGTKMVVFKMFERNVLDGFTLSRWQFWTLKAECKQCAPKKYHVLVKVPFCIMIIFGIWQRLAYIKHRYGLFLVWQVKDLPCDTPTCDGWSLRSCPLCLWTSNPKGAPRPQSLQTQFSEQTFLDALASLYFKLSLKWVSQWL